MAVIVALLSSGLGAAHQSSAVAFPVESALGQDQISPVEVVDSFQRGELDVHGAFASPYIVGRQGDQTFNRQKAIDSGRSKVQVALGEQIVAANNWIMEQTGKGVLLEEVDMSQFPLVASFDKVAAAQAPKPEPGESDEGGDNNGNDNPPPDDDGRQVSSSGRVKPDTNPCGGYNNPLPNKAPRRKVYKKKGQGKYLLSIGFHRTAGYACGANSRYKCANDYTRGREYRSGYGHCSSPVFRDQGYVLGGRDYWIQYGEPSPEIHSYVWPYPTWPGYCRWWHNTH